MCQTTNIPGFNSIPLHGAIEQEYDDGLPPPDKPVITLFAVKDGISTEDLLVNLSETLASANALTCDLAFELDETRRESALGIAQLIELARLLGDRVLENTEKLTLPKADRP